MLRLQFSLNRAPSSGCSGTGQDQREGVPRDGVRVRARPPLPLVGARPPHEAGQQPQQGDLRRQGRQRRHAALHGVPLQVGRLGIFHTSLPNVWYIVLLCLNFDITWSLFH